MIIVCDLMVHIDLIDDLKRKLLELDHYTVPMKYPCNLLGNTNPTNCEIQEVVIQNPEQVSTSKCTDIVFKILYSTYNKSYPDNYVYSDTQ